MANIHGRNAFVAFVDAAGASQNLSGDGNNCLLTESVNNPERTSFGMSNVARAGSGLNDAKFQYEGWANDTATTGNMAVFAGLKGTITQIAYAPSGSIVGSTCPVKYCACMLIDSAEIRAPVAGLVTMRATLSLASASIVKSACWQNTISG